MAQEVHHIKIFPEEQIQVLGKTTIGGKDYYLIEEGLKNVDDATVPIPGVSRVGDKKPTDYRATIKKTDGTDRKIPNRIPRIPCQFVVIAFDKNGAKVNGGDVKDGLLFNGAVLPNGNVVEMTWNATMKNGKWYGTGYAVGYLGGDNRSPKKLFEETSQSTIDAAKSVGSQDRYKAGNIAAYLGFMIDDTGLLVAGNDNPLEIKNGTVIGGVTFTNDFTTDHTCYGSVSVSYGEVKPDGTSVPGTNKAATAGAVIAQPDWVVAEDDSSGWEWKYASPNETWRCEVCGFTYKGGGLPPGYICPKCGSTAFDHLSTLPFIEA